MADSTRYEPPVKVIAAVSQGAGTVTGAGGTYDGAAQLAVLVNNTAQSGTPSLAITVRWSFDGVNWFDPDPTADTMTAITAVGKKVKTFARKAPFYQVSAVVSGTTPSMTFDVYTWTFG